MRKPELWAVRNGESLWISVGKPSVYSVGTCRSDFGTGRVDGAFEGVVDDGFMSRIEWHADKVIAIGKPVRFEFEW